jgi:hypothetical protein
VGDVDRRPGQAARINEARAVELFRSSYQLRIEVHPISVGSPTRLVARLDGQTSVSDEQREVKVTANDAATVVTH